MRKLALRLGLVLAALVFALLLAEGAVRVAGLAPELVVLSSGRYRLSANPAIGYEPIPGFAFDSSVPPTPEQIPPDLTDPALRRQWQEMWEINQAGFDYRGASNRMGYRDRDHEVQKPAGVYRVVVLGDSVAAGLFIRRYEDTFPARLEVELRDRGIDAEVINLSVNGYNTQQEVETLVDRGLQFSPDLVLLAYCVNDRKMSGNNVLLRLIEKERGQAGLGAITTWLVHGSHLCRLVRYRLWPEEEPELPPEYASLGEDTVEKYFGELARLQAEHGFETLVANLPLLRNLDKPYPPRWEEERVFVERLSEKYGLWHLDLRPAFRECELAAGEQIYFDALHPTEEGHRCAAEALAKYIAENMRRR